LAAEQPKIPVVLSQREAAPQRQIMRPGYEQVAECLHHDQRDEGDGLCAVDKVIEARHVINVAALVAGSPFVKG